jgi:hypothetical protein
MARPAKNGEKAKVEIAIPVFGYRNHVSIDRAYGFVRRFAVTNAAAHDGARLPEVLDKKNTAGPVWADTAYRSHANEKHMEKNGFVSKVRSAVETVFAAQKHRFGLFVRTIGATRARVKIGLPNIAYNVTRMIWLKTRLSPA